MSSEPSDNKIDNTTAVDDNDDADGDQIQKAPAAAGDDKDGDGTDDDNKDRTEELVTALTVNNRALSSAPIDAMKQVEIGTTEEQTKKVIGEEHPKEMRLTSETQATTGAYSVVTRVGSGAGSGVEDSHSDEEYDDDQLAPRRQDYQAGREMEAPMSTSDETTSGIADHGESTSSQDRPSIIVSAENVETGVRERIMRETVVADVIDSKRDTPATRGRHPVLIGLVLAAVFVLIILVVSLSIYFTRDQSDNDEATTFATLSPAPTSAPPMIPILETVKQNGVVRCGVYTVAPGFILLTEESGRYEGISADLVSGSKGLVTENGIRTFLTLSQPLGSALLHPQCRAVSAIVFDGDTEKVEFVPTTAVDRYENLNSGTLDIVSQTVTHTMERDVAEATTGIGFNFQPPFYYSGTGFGGLPEFVDCAERLDSFFGVCRDLRVCVGMGTTQEAVLLDLLPGPAIVPLATPQDMFAGFATGACQIFAADLVNIPVARIRATGYDGPYKLGTKLFSRDPLCLLTSDHDNEWASLIDLMMHILITAEAQNVTKASASSWGAQQLESGVLDETLIQRVVNVVGGVGNLGELYELHMEPIVPRDGLNLVNMDSSSNSSGLLYSIPYGDLRTARSANLTGTILESILEAGQVRCAIVSPTTEQGALSDFHRQYCNALTVALFLDIDESVMVPVSDDSSGFDALINGEADVFIGPRVTLEYLSSALYSFSTPTYFDEDGGALALATLNTDPTWAEFVNWIVVAIVQAEEDGITQANSVQMPVVNLYGEDLKQMFRDCIAAVGNYGEIFNRTLEQSGTPRSGRNRLNAGLDGPQHFPVPFR